MSSKLVADVDKINSGMKTLSTEVDSFSSAVSSFTGQSVNCSLEEVSSVLESYKSSINDDVKKVETSSAEYVELVNECSSEYVSNEGNVQEISVDAIANIVSSAPELFGEYQGNAATRLTGLPSTDLGITAGFIPYGENGEYLMLNFSEEDISKIFGSQLDNNGSSGYGADSIGCDDYARGYCIYVQNGVVASKASVGSSDGANGLTSKQISADNRKQQAEIAYELLQQGKPSVIHVNSPSTGSGLGHWVTVVGCRKGVTKESVKVDDLIILDPVTGTVRSTTEDSEYLREDTGRCSYEPGYHINYYET